MINILKTKPHQLLSMAARCLFILWLFITWFVIASQPSHAATSTGASVVTDVASTEEAQNSQSSTSYYEDLTDSDGYYTYIGKNYKIKIDSQCPEGYVTCENVKGVFLNLQTNKIIVLIGRTRHSRCRDLSPCHFQGYLFENANTTYFIDDSSTLHIYQD